MNAELCEKNFTKNPYLILHTQVAMQTTALRFFKVCRTLKDTNLDIPQCLLRGKCQERCNQCSYCDRSYQIININAVNVINLSHKMLILTYW